MAFCETRHKRRQSLPLPLTDKRPTAPATAAQLRRVCETCPDTAKRRVKPDFYPIFGGAHQNAAAFLPTKSNGIFQSWWNFCLEPLTLRRLRGNMSDNIPSTP
jgi:hypothetical protein